MGLAGCCNLTLRILWFHQPNVKTTVTPRASLCFTYTPHMHFHSRKSRCRADIWYKGRVPRAEGRVPRWVLSSRPAARPRASGRSPSFQVVVQHSIVTRKMVYGECMCIASIQCCFAPCGLFYRFYASLLWWHAPYPCCTRYELATCARSLR